MSQPDSRVYFAALMWRRGLDTKAIAIQIRLSEAWVYNRIEQIKRLALQPQK